MSTIQRNPYQVMLVCRNAEGAPAFFAAKVVCTPEEYDAVDHLDMVCEAAEAAGNVVSEEIPTLCDETDPLGKVLDYGADWEAAPVLDLAEYNAKQAVEA